MKRAAFISHSKDGWRVRLGVRRQAGQISTYVLDITSPQGVRERRACGTADYETAVAAYNAFLRDELPVVASESVPTPQAGGNARIRDVVEWYVGTHLPHLGRAKKTIWQSRQVLEDLDRFASHRHIGRVSQLTWRTIEEFCRHQADGRSMAANTRRNWVNVIRACMNAAVDAGLMDASPIRKWITPKAATPEPDALSAQELQHVLDAVADTDIEGIVRLMAWTGLRPSDATDLRWREVYSERGVIKRNQIKTHNPVTIAITPEIRAVLDMERAKYSDAKPQSRVFRNRDGDPITPRALYGQFAHRMAQAGLSDRVTLKILRPTFGTAAARAGVNPKALHIMLGHTDIKMTMRYYIAVSDEDLKEAQEKILKSMAHNGTPPKKPKK